MPKKPNTGITPLVNGCFALKCFLFVLCDLLSKLITVFSKELAGPMGTASNSSFPAAAAQGKEGTAGQEGEGGRPGHRATLGIACSEKMIFGLWPPTSVHFHYPDYPVLFQFGLEGVFFSLGVGLAVAFGLEDGGTDMEIAHK